MVFKPLPSGLLQGQSKLIPRFALGQQGIRVVLEWTLAKKPVNTTATYGTDPSWDITDARVCYNSPSVDSEPVSSSSSAILQGRPIMCVGTQFQPCHACIARRICVGRHD